MQESGDIMDIVRGILVYAIDNSELFTKWKYYIFILHQYYIFIQPLVGRAFLSFFIFLSR